MADQMIVNQMVQEGVIVPLNDGLNTMKCNVCGNKKMSGTTPVVQHLNGSSHKEKAARFAMNHPDTAPRSFLNLLLPHTRRAAVDRRIIRETASGNVMCTVCEVTLTGTRQIEDHLVGDDHNKKVNNAPITPRPDQAIAVRPQPPVVARTSPDQIAVNQMVQEGVIVSLNDGLNTMECVVCDNKMSGTTPVVQHLNGSSHKEKAARFAMIHPDTAPRSFLNLLLPHTRRAAVDRRIIRETASGNVMCTVCEVTLTGTRQIEDHLVGDDHNKTVNNAPIAAILNQATAVRFQPLVVPSPSPCQSEPAWGGQDDDEKLIERAQLAGVVRLTDNIAQSYVCDPCSKRFNGKRTLLDHLKSKQHKKNEGVGSNFTPGPIDRQVSVMAYSVTSVPRGQVHVFNNIFQGQGKKWYREGAEIDSRNLKSVFKEMGYLVACHENLNEANTMEMMVKIQTNGGLSNVDSLIILILSHGKDPYTFYTNDQKEVSLYSIRQKFTDSKCPTMKGKPKIFLTNYCRGTNMEKREVDGLTVEVPSDMVTIHAAAEGVMALRTATRGTYFVDSLCKVLKSYDHSLELRDIYNRVYETMKEHNSTKPMWEDYGFIKKFSFNPV